MPSRRTAPSVTSTPKPSPGAAKAPTREALLAALAERERRLVEAQERQNTLAETLQEALERQTVTSEVLRVISQSRSDARPVFESIVCAAARLLRCDMAFVLLRDGDAYIHTAGATPEGPLADLAPDRMPIDPDANFPSRAFLTKSELHLPDWSQIDLPEHECRIHERFGVNSALYLPLLRDDECIGLLALAGSRPDMFGPSQIAQAGSFRDQALIAIENSRQFNETQEALEQQKASAEVLGAISKSVADTTPVFETILDACRRLLGSDETGIYAIGDDNMVRVAAWRGPRAEEVRHDVTPREKALPAGSSGNAASTTSPISGPRPISAPRFEIGWIVSGAPRCSMLRCCGRIAASARSSSSARLRGPFRSGSMRFCRASPIRRRSRSRTRGCSARRRRRCSSKRPQPTC